MEPPYSIIRHSLIVPSFMPQQISFPTPLKTHSFLFTLFQSPHAYYFSLQLFLLSTSYWCWPLCFKQIASLSFQYVRADREHGAFIDWCLPSLTPHLTQEQKEVSSVEWVKAPMFNASKFRPLLSLGWLKLVVSDVTS